MLKPVVHVASCPRPDCCRPRLLPEPHGHRCRGSRPSPASRRSEAETVSAAVAPSGSALLDNPAVDLVSLEGCALHCQAGNGRRLASGWISALLALEISAAWRPAEDNRGSSRPDSALGAGELRLGRSENPWRIAEARLCDLREDRRALLAAHSAPG